VLLAAGLVWCARRLLRREATAATLRRWVSAGMGTGCLFLVVTVLGRDHPLDTQMAGGVAAVATALHAMAAWRAWQPAQAWLLPVQLFVPQWMAL
jgi:hypothetical protein